MDMGVVCVRGVGWVCVVKGGDSRSVTPGVTPGVHCVYLGGWGGARVKVLAGPERHRRCGLEGVCLEGVPVAPPKVRHPVYIMCNRGTHGSVEPRWYR